MYVGMALVPLTVLSTPVACGPGKPYRADVQRMYMVAWRPCYFVYSLPVGYGPGTPYRAGVQRLYVVVWCYAMLCVSFPQYLASDSADFLYIYL